MPIHVTCSCGKQLHAPDEFAGRQTRCPACSQLIVVPASATVQPSPPPGPPPPMPSSYAPPLGQEYPAGPPGTSGKAIFSMILGILAFCLPYLLSIPAIILGILSLRSINRSGGRLTGNGMAITGIVLGGVTLATGLPCIGFMYGVVIGFNEAKDASAYRKESVNNLQQIGLAMHTYADANNSSLPTERLGADQHVQPLLSWRVHILPYLGSDEMKLYGRFNLNEPWDSPQNKALLSEMPAVYLNRRFQAKSAQKEGLTYYRGFVGKDAVLGLSTPTTLGIITSSAGTTNTLLVVEAGEPVPWTKPEDTSFGGKGPFGGPRRIPFLALWADGHVSTIPQTTDPKTIDLLTRYNRTEMISPP